jgi:hypothetical protein
VIVIGLDPGVSTGFATWSAQTRQLLEVRSMLLHEAMTEVAKRHAAGELALVIFEDARKRRCFGRADLNQLKYGAAVREGAGAAKRDAKIWDDFLTSIGVPFLARAPRGTKKKTPHFELLTGWKGRTNEHGRDAALVVYGLNVPIVAGLVRDFHTRRNS